MTCSFWCTKYNSTNRPSRLARLYMTAYVHKPVAPRKLKAYQPTGQWTQVDILVSLGLPLYLAGVRCRTDVEP